MEWERAKTYILLFFVLLNLILGSLLLMERRRYTLSPQREQEIALIMERNNISMEASLMRRFPPMRVMWVGGFHYDRNQLVEIFFQDTELTRVFGPNGYVVTSDNGKLLLDQGFISYDNPMGHGGRDDWLPSLEQAQAQDLTDAFVSTHWPDFELDDVVIGSNWLRLSYRQVYRGYMVHTNFIEITVTTRGIIRVEMQFGHVLTVERERQPITAPDEVLLTFIQRMRGHALDTPIVVTHMDLVYFQDEGSPDPEGRYRLEPYFRIFIDGDEGDPFLINAFTNEIIN
ncbi:MAG: hypothetical protein FWC73_05350 [Defluviitaleaceae bacterium]|nr:hypothetical protein [Defluviitaleaceae bacterium]